MTIDPMIIWTGIITLIIGPMAWAFRYLILEVKAQQLLLRETREDYVKKQDLKSEMEDLHKKMDRLEDLLIKVVGNLKIE